MQSFTGWRLDADSFYDPLDNLVKLHKVDIQQFGRVQRSQYQVHLVQNGRVKEVDLEMNHLEAEVNLRRFLDYLAQICMFSEGSPTITAVTIRMDEEKQPQYIFVSNRRGGHAERTDMQCYIRDVISRFADFTYLSPMEQREKCKEVLHYVLRKNWRRVGWYAQRLSDRLKNLQSRNLDESSSELLHRIQNLLGQELSLLLNGSKSDIEPVLRLMRILRTAEDLSNDGIFGHLNHIVARGQQIEQMSQKPLSKKDVHVLWHDVQHILRRIISYHEAVTNFRNTALEHPLLFAKHPKINFLKSFTSGSGNDCHIHAEVQLWNYIKFCGNRFVPYRPVLDNGESFTTKPAIIMGISKPPCLLCSWYLRESVRNQRLVVKGTSNNVYGRWTAPELWGSWDGDDRVFKALVRRVRVELKKAQDMKIILRQDADTPTNPSVPNTPFDFVRASEGEDSASTTDIDSETYMKGLSSASGTPDPSSDSDFEPLDASSMSDEQMAQAMRTLQL